MRSIAIGLLLFSLAFSALYVYDSGAFLVENLSCPASLEHPSYFSDVFVEGASSYSIDVSSNKEVTLYLNNGDVFRGSLVSTLPITLNISGANYVFPSDSVLYYVVNPSEERTLNIEGFGACTLYRAIPSASWRAVYILNNGVLQSYADINLPEQFNKNTSLYLISGTVFNQSMQQRYFLERAASSPEVVAEENSFYYSYELGMVEAKKSTMLLFTSNVSEEIINVFRYYGGSGSSSADAYVRFTPPVPLPKGILLFVDDGIVAGVPTLPNSPADKELSLRVGNSFNVFATYSSKLLEKRVVDGVEETLYEVKWDVRNYGSRDQKVEVRVPLSQYVEIRNATYEVDGNDAVFKLSLQGGEKASVSFTYVTKNPWVRPY